MQEAKKITNKFPQNLLAWESFSITLSNYKDYDQSIECMQIAINLAPNDAEIYNNYGVTLEAKGDLKNAKENFQKAISIRTRLC